MFLQPQKHHILVGRMSSFHSAMAETSVSGVPSTKTLSHREAVLPFLLAGSRWELVSATTVCINSTFDLVVIFEGDLQKRPPDFGLRDLHKEMEVLFFAGSVTRCRSCRERGTGCFRRERCRRRLSTPSSSCSCGTPERLP